MWNKQMWKKIAFCLPFILEKHFLIVKFSFLSTPNKIYLTSQVIGVLSEMSDGKNWTARYVVGSTRQFVLLRTWTNHLIKL